MKGKIVLLILFQAGGIGIVSFATFFASFVKKGIGHKHESLIKEFINPDGLFSTRSIFRQIIIITMLFEAIGCFFIYIFWEKTAPFSSHWEKLFVSVFHSVSAFCNAGFSTFSNSLYQEEVRHSYLVHIVIACLIFMGGIGFATIRDLFSPTILRDRLMNPWKEWKLGTKIAVYTSFLLIFLGAIGIYFLEKENTLKGFTLMEQIILSTFQSVTARTAGFNTVDIGSLMTPTLILIVFLMFIGASPGSTGGGIKATTFVLLTVSTISTIKGKKYIEIDKRTITSELMHKALSVFAIAALYNILSLFALTITEPDVELKRLLFEQVSAFGTVGLSTGITSQLSDYGKLILIFSMFLGRVGTLTLAFSLSSTSSSSHKYPKANLLVG